MVEGAIMPIMVKREGYVTSARYTCEEWIEKKRLEDDEDVLE